jgi:hypothetical protein
MKSVRTTPGLAMSSPPVPTQRNPFTTVYLDAMDEAEDFAKRFLMSAMFLPPVVTSSLSTKPVVNE